MLVKVVEEETEYEDGEAETSKSIITFTYDSDNLEDYFNEYYQYTPSNNYLEGMGDGELEEAVSQHPTLPLTVLAILTLIQTLEMTDKTQSLE